MWFEGRARIVPRDPVLPLGSRDDYSNVTFVRDGPPLAHAVEPGSTVPECGAAGRVLPHGFPWSHPVPSHWQRCASCLSRHPV